MCVSSPPDISSPVPLLPGLFLIQHVCFITARHILASTPSCRLVFAPTCILRCIRDKSLQGALDSPIPGQLCNSVPSASTATRQYPLDAYFHSLLLPARLLVLRLTICVTCETGQKKLACFASAACMFPRSQSCVPCLVHCRAFVLAHGSQVFGD